MSDFLKKHGFETHSLKGRSFADEVKLFKESEFMIIPHGSSMTSALFCDKGTKIIQIHANKKRYKFEKLYDQCWSDNISQHEDVGKDECTVNRS